MEKFKKWLNVKNEWIERATIDNSCKGYFCGKEHKVEKDGTNKDLAVLGDALLKLAFTEFLLDERTVKLTEAKKLYESDKSLVEYIAKEYKVIENKFIKFEDANKAYALDYDCAARQGVNYKYIATFIEAMIGAIYKSTNSLDEVKEILKEWKTFIDNNKKM